MLVPISPERQRPLLYRLDEAAHALGLSPRTVWQLIADGKLTAVRIGRSLRIDRRDLVALIDAHRAQGAGQ
jgi:excisionase family DNA binding protein